MQNLRYLILNDNLLESLPAGARYQSGAKYVCKNIYVIANEVKQSQTPAIASFRFAPFASDIVYLILHNYLSTAVGRRKSNGSLMAVLIRIKYNFTKELVYSTRPPCKGLTLWGVGQAVLISMRD